MTGVSLTLLKKIEEAVEPPMDEAVDGPGRQCAIQPASPQWSEWLGRPSRRFVATSSVNKMDYFPPVATPDGMPKMFVKGLL
jgi:hypothetical protein